MTTRTDPVPARPGPAVIADRVERSSRWRVGMVCAGWVAVAVYLQLVRGPGHRAPDVIWAEDGSVFLNQAMRHSLWHNLLVPHAGYLQTVARLLAQPAAHLPVSWAAIWLAAAAALTVALISLLVWFASAHVVKSTWARLLLTALVPLLPQAGFEVNAVVSDLHWYLAYAAFWALLAAPCTLRGQIGSSIVVALAALSDPLVALVAPAAVFGVLRASRRRVALIAPAALGAALAVQVAVYLAFAPPARTGPASLSDLPWIYGLRVLLSAVTGDRMLSLLYPRLGLSLVAIVSVAVLTGLAVLWRKADRSARWAAVTALTVSVAYLVVSLGLRGNGGMLARDAFALNESRYTIVPLLTLWTAVVVLTDRVPHRPHTRLRGLPVTTSVAIGIVTAGFLTVQLFNDWGAPSVRSNAPSWSQSLRAAAANCRTPPEARSPQPTPLVAEYRAGYPIPIVPGPDDVTIVLPPRAAPGHPLLFGVVLPCSLVNRDQSD